MKTITASEARSKLYKLIDEAAVNSEPVHITGKRAAPRLTIDQILHPRSVAVLGASDNVAKFGGRITSFLVKHGFAGDLFPISRHQAQILGRKAYAGIGALPSAPEHWLTVHDDPFRPQPRRDRDAEGGMTTSVGRVREDSVLPNGMKWVLVSHNTKMGAAKGAILAAEWCKVKGQLG